MTKVCLAAMLVLSLATAAQSPPAQSNSKITAPQASIEVKINGLGCQTAAGTGTFSVQAWSWGASNSGSSSVGGGGGAGKANIQDLSITKRADQCSPSLFGAVATGKHYATLTLTQADANGNVVATVTLTEVLVSSWQIGGTTGSVEPSESISFNFAKVCIAETAGGGKFCYDIAENKVF